jgi:hypothetical protein
VRRRAFPRKRRAQLRRMGISPGKFGLQRIIDGIEAFITEASR